MSQSKQSTGFNQRWRPGVVACLGLIVVFVLPSATFWLRDLVSSSVRPTDNVTTPPELSDQSTPWDTESFSAAADEQLKSLAKLFEHPDEITKQQVSELLSPAFRCGPLRPSDLVNVYSDKQLTVHRGQSIEAAEDSADSSIGDGGMADLLAALKEATRDMSDVRVKFKLFRVEVAGPAVTTRLYFQLVGETPRGRIQQTATWRCRWLWRESDSAPLLESIDVEDYEEVIAAAGTGEIFSDKTEALLADNASLHGALLEGIDDWRAELQVDFGVGLHGHHGIAIGDVNADGREDIYICQPGGLPNKLLVQNADGTLSDRSAESGTDWLDRSWGALLLDLDNDGDRDLVVVMDPNVLILSNDGRGRFTQQAVFYYLQGDAYALAAADYDNDGDVDIFVASYGARFPGANIDTDRPGIPVPYHDANNGSANVLLRNEGDWTFRDVTAECGLDANNRRWSFSAAWEDYDNDGDQDLYVANDFGRNNLYRNDGGHFIDVAADAGVEDIAAGMSVAWGDYDNDGLMDLYVGNMFSSAGGRIAYQRKFQASADSSTRRQFQRHARGNSLFKNVGDGTFRDVSVDAHVTMGRWAWGSKFIDINNDGWEDIFVANGFITGPETRDL